MAQCATTALAGAVPLVLCLSRFPLPAPRVPRCVWWAVSSGCPLPSLAGTPFHAVCAFRGLGPVALLVFPACPLRVCALALPRRPLPPPPLGGMACAPHAVPALGAGRAVPRGLCPSARPAPVPCSVWHAWGGAVGSWFPPTWLGAVRPPWGWQKGVPGGVPSTVAGGVRCQALPLPQLPAHWAGCWVPLPTCCRRGRGGVGAHHGPLGLHALWGLRAVGVVGGRPRGGWPATVVRGVWCQALSLPLGRAAGVLRPVCPGCGRCGRGTQHRPHSVRPCGPALLAVGVAEGRSRGAAFHHCEGRLWSGAPPPRTARPLGGLSGSATHMLWARACGCPGPTLSPCPACPVGAACCGGGGGPSPGGMACHRCEGRPMSGAVPPPAARPPWRAAGVP